LCLAMIADSGFKNKTEPGKPRQGILIRIQEDRQPPVPGGKGNLIAHRTQLVKRAVRSTLGAETLAQVGGYDIAARVRIEWSSMNVDKPLDAAETDHDWLWKSLPLDVYTDCNSLWGIKQGHRLPIEANLMPDIVQLRDANTNGQIRRSFWIPTVDMCADALTKSMGRVALQEVSRGNWNTTGEYALAPPIHLVIEMYAYVTDMLLEQ
jgi:hypothetical protein